MHQQTATADGFAEAGDPGDHIRQQGRTEALAFVAFIHPQAGEERHGLGVAAGATAQPLRQIQDRHARYAPGVVGDDNRLIHLGHHKDAGGASSMGLPGHLHQPGGLFLEGAAEACELVADGNQLTEAGGLRADEPRRCEWGLKAWKRTGKPWQGRRAPRPNSADKEPAGKGLELARDSRQLLPADPCRGRPSQPLPLRPATPCPWHPIPHGVLLILNATDPDGVRKGPIASTATLRPAACPVLSVARGQEKMSGSGLPDSLGTGLQSFRGSAPQAGQPRREREDAQPDAAWRSRCAQPAPPGGRHRSHRPKAGSAREPAASPPPARAISSLQCGEFTLDASQGRVYGALQDALVAAQPGLEQQKQIFFWLVERTYRCNWPVRGRKGGTGYGEVHRGAARGLIPANARRRGDPKPERAGACPWAFTIYRGFGQSTCMLY